MGMSVSPSAASKQKKELLERQSAHIADLLMKEKIAHETGMNQSVTFKSSDIIGDNIDITRSPSQMSVDRKRKSWHWFLLVGLQKRVINQDLDDSTPIADINRVDNSLFVPNLEDCNFLDRNYIHHIMHVLVKYVGCLKKYDKCLPKHLPHPHIDDLSKKSDYAMLDLLDKSENKSEDMISILEHIHDKFIPRTDDDPYSAQLAMLNHATDYDKLTGVIHRPEGFHRMMNLLLVLFRKFS
jgi:hypothetical protein